jgi:hypothetical protein
MPLCRRGACPLATLAVNTAQIRDHTADIVGTGLAPVRKMVTCHALSDRGKPSPYDQQGFRYVLVYAYLSGIDPCGRW